MEENLNVRMSVDIKSARKVGERIVELASILNDLNDKFDQLTDEELYYFIAMTGRIEDELSHNGGLGRRIYSNAMSMFLEKRDSNN